MPANKWKLLVLLLCLFWQREPELHAFWQVFHAAFPILHGDDALDNIQPKAYMGKGVSIIFLCGEESIPDLLHLFLGDGLPRIVDAHPNIRFLLF